MMGLIRINPIILGSKVNMDGWQIKLNMMGMEDGDLSCACAKPEPRPGARAQRPPPMSGLIRQPSPRPGPAALHPGAAQAQVFRNAQMYNSLLARG